MTRWLLVHPSDEMYGADRVLLEIADALGAPAIDGCWLPTDVDYPCRPLGSELGGRGIAVRRWDFPVLRRAYVNPPGLGRVAGRALRAARPGRRMAAAVDAIYLNTSAVLPMAPLLRARNRTLVCHVHEYWGATERRMLAPLLRFCDVRIAVSAAVAQTLPGRVAVVHNGFPDLPTPPAPPPADGPLQVLLASRWSSWKGHREFLTAWRAAALPAAHLTVVGGPPPSGAGIDVPAVVADLGLTGSVTVLPERADITELIAGAHVVAVPSVRPDPLPTIAIEAARAGRATLASACGGLPEIVEDGVTGWLAQPGDVGAWTGRLRELSIAGATERGVIARRRYLERFTVDRFRADLLRATAGSARAAGTAAPPRS